MHDMSLQVESIKSCMVRLMPWT